MHKVRLIVRRQPLATALVIVAVYFAIFFIPQLFSDQSFGRGKPISGAIDLAAQLPLEVALALSVLGIVWLVGWWLECRFATPLQPGGLKFLVAPVLFAAVLLALVAYAVATEATVALRDALPLPLVASLIAVTLLIGVFEETLFRGILFHGIEENHGLTVAVVGSSLVFGLMHYVNWVGGQPFLLTSGQVAHAVAAGFMYAALMLRIGSIWPVILFHGFWDAAVASMGTLGAQLPGADQASQGSGILIAAVFVAFELSYGLFVLWSTRRMRAMSHA